MATEQTGQRLLKKLTIKTFIGGKPDILAAAQTGKANAKDLIGKPVPILRVLGQVTGYKAGESDFGSYVELRGAFMGTNLLTGDVMENCSKAILPDVVGDAIAEALKGGASSAEFAIEVDCVYDEAAATMYTYQVRTLLKPKVAAPVASLLARLTSEGVKMTAPLKIAAPVLSDADKKKQTDSSAAADAERNKKKEGAKV